jgi:hypothetical protein
MAKEPIILSDQIIPPPALMRAGLESLPAIIRAQGERAGRAHLRGLEAVPTLPACHEAREVARASSLTQLAQRLRLDLANTFARDSKQFADLFESTVVLLPDPETHPQDLLFAGRQRRKDLARQLAEITPDRRLDR